MATLALNIYSLIYWSNPRPHILQIQAQTHHCSENTGKVLNYNNKPTGTVFHTLSHHTNNHWNIQMCRIWLHLCHNKGNSEPNWHCDLFMFSLLLKHYYQLLLLLPILISANIYYQWWDEDKMKLHHFLKQSITPLLSWDCEKIATMLLIWPILYEANVNLDFYLFRFWLILLCWTPDCWNCPMLNTIIDANLVRLQKEKENTWGRKLKPDCLQ